MTIIDRVAPPTPTGVRTALPPPVGTRPAAATTDRTRAVADRLDQVVARFDEVGPVPPRPTGTDDLALLSAVARAILDAGIERGAEEHDTIQALPLRRTAWVHARQDQFVIAHLLDGPAPIDLGTADTVGSDGSPDRSTAEAAWYRHLAVHEHAERGLRHVKTAIGDSAVAPDPELAGYEHDLRVLARYGPGAGELWDRLAATIDLAADPLGPARP